MEVKEERAAPWYVSDLDGCRARSAGRRAVMMAMDCVISRRSSTNMPRTMAVPPRGNFFANDVGVCEKIATWLVTTFERLPNIHSNGGTVGC